jgi:hypothetical protein
MEPILASCVPRILMTSLISFCVLGFYRALSIYYSITCKSHQKLLMVGSYNGFIRVNRVPCHNYIRMITWLGKLSRYSINLPTGCFKLQTLKKPTRKNIRALRLLELKARSLFDLPVKNYSLNFFVCESNWHKI